MAGLEGPRPARASQETDPFTLGQQRMALAQHWELNKGSVPQSDFTSDSDSAAKQVRVFSGDMASPGWGEGAQSIWGTRWRHHDTV